MSNHRLVFVDGLQRALTRLRLIRRVSSVVFTARGDLPHRRRDMMLIGASTDKTDSAFILARARRHQRGHFHFRETVRQLFQCAGFQMRRNFIEQILNAGNANGVEHGLHIFRGVGNIGHGDSVSGQASSSSWAA